MANPVVNYDINIRHTEVKRDMETKGYFDYFTSGGVTYYLPNTTLWKPNVSLAQGKADIEAVIANLNLGVTAVRRIVLERLIVTDITPHVAIPGQAHRE